MIHLRSTASRFPRLLAALSYTGVCFFIGCILGMLRGIWLAPTLGHDRALAIEMIIMLLVTAAAARSSIQRAAVPMGVGNRLAVGGIAVILLVIAEEGLARLISNESIFDVWGAQSEQAQVITAMIMLTFTGMPALVGPSKPPTVPSS